MCCGQMKRESRAGRSVRWFFRWFETAIASRMTSEPPYLTADHLIATHSQVAADPLLALVNGAVLPWFGRHVMCTVCDSHVFVLRHLASCADMSRLDVYVLVAMAHLDFGNNKPFNFEMVFEEYARFASSDIAALQMFPKDVALKVRTTCPRSAPQCEACGSRSLTSVPRPFPSTQTFETR